MYNTGWITSYVGSHISPSMRHLGHLYIWDSHPNLPQKMERWQLSPVGTGFSVKGITPSTPGNILSKSPLTIQEPKEESPPCRFLHGEIYSRQTPKSICCWVPQGKRNQVASTQCHQNGQNPSLAMPNCCNTPLRELSLTQTLREHKTLQWVDCTMQSHVETPRAAYKRKCPVKWTTC